MPTPSAEALPKLRGGLSGRDTPPGLVGRGEQDHQQREISDPEPWSVWEALSPELELKRRTVGGEATARPCPCPCLGPGSAQGGAVSLSRSLVCRPWWLWNPEERAAEGTLSPLSPFAADGGGSLCGRGHIGPDCIAGSICHSWRLFPLPLSVPQSLTQHDNSAEKRAEGG